MVAQLGGDLVQGLGVGVSVAAGAQVRPVLGEQLDRLLAGEHRDIDGPAGEQVGKAGGDEHAAGLGERE